MTLDENKRVWANYAWPKGGEEWSEGAGGSESLWRRMILPRIDSYLPTKTILEIAPGRGRWTQYLLNYCERLVGVDLDWPCVAACRNRFAGDKRASFCINDGKSLRCVRDDSFDLIFSFDSLVHADEEVMEAYVSQLATKLTESGVAFLHHSNSGNCANKVGERDPNMTAEKFAAMCDRHGLSCLSQELITWSSDDLSDCLSIVRVGPTSAGQVIVNKGFKDEMLQKEQLTPVVGAVGEGRPIKDRYVVVSEFSTFRGKHWLYPNGWQEVVDWLVCNGYRVASISKEPTALRNVARWNGRPIEETINNIRHADLMVTVSNGPMWLAHALGVPTVVISGFTLPYSEPSECYRVINDSVCVGCYHDFSFPFDREGSGSHCPRERNYECSTSITPGMVLDKVRQALRDKGRPVVEARPIDPTRVRRLFVVPHLSTGGQPQYALQQIQKALGRGELVEVLEWNHLSDEYVVQRKKIQELCRVRVASGDRSTELWKIINLFKPNVVHLQEFSESFMDEVSASVLYSRFNGCSIVETTHDSRFEPAMKRRLPDRIEVVCRHHQVKFAELGVPVDLVPYEVRRKARPDRTSALKKLGLDPSLKHVLNVGLFTPGKNQGEAFEVARLVPRAQFHFVGNLAQNFADYWRPLVANKPDNCVLWGEREDVDAFYSSMDAMLFASTSELAPIVVREALGWGMPVLMRNLPIYLGEWDCHTLVSYITDDVGDAAEKLVYLLG
jgi:glycosyltransferase involved in cell wall biosynthesis